MWIASLVFCFHVVVSVVTSITVDGGAFNDAYFGMPLPLAVIAIGVAAFLFLVQKVQVSAWVWAIIIGSFGSNLFERVVFKSVFDYIPCGIGYCNTADLGILVGLLFLAGGVYDKAKGGKAKR